MQTSTPTPSCQLSNSTYYPIPVTNQSQVLSFKSKLLFNPSYYPILLTIQFQLIAYSSYNSITAMFLRPTIFPILAILLIPAMFTIPAIFQIPLIPATTACGHPSECTNKVQPLIMLKKFHSVLRWALTFNISNIKKIHVFDSDFIYKSQGILWFCPA